MSPRQAEAHGREVPCGRTHSQLLQARRTAPVLAPSVLFSLSLSTWCHTHPMAGPPSCLAPPWTRCWVPAPLHPEPSWPSAHWQCHVSHNLQQAVAILASPSNAFIHMLPCTHQNRGSFSTPTTALESPEGDKHGSTQHPERAAVQAQCLLEREMLPRGMSLHRK